MDSEDNYKLDNNEELEIYCDKCEERTTEYSSVLAMGRFELVCDICAEDMIFCDTCCRVGEEDDFSHNHEKCNYCIELAVDKLIDND
jgi:hypothetical protein